LIISDVFTDASGSSTLFATLFDLNMMLTADDGVVHADAVLSDRLNERYLYCLSDVDEWHKDALLHWVFAGK